MPLRKHGRFKRKCHGELGFSAQSLDQIVVVRIAIIHVPIIDGI